jgi:hypothetical protein
MALSRHTKDRLSDVIWEAVDECVQSGMTLEEFVKEFKLCWTEATKRQLQDEIDRLERLSLVRKP